MDLPERQYIKYKNYGKITATQTANVKKEFEA